MTRLIDATTDFSTPPCPPPPAPTAHHRPLGARSADLTPGNVLVKVRGGVGHKSSGHTTLKKNGLACLATVSLQ